VSNDYFDNTSNRVANGAVARARDVNNVIDATESGFDLLPSPDALWADTAAVGVVGGTANGLILTIGGQAPVPYIDGQGIVFRTTQTNTGACTLALDDGSPKSLVSHSAEALQANDLVAGRWYGARFNTSTDQWQIVSDLTRSSLENAIQQAEAAQVAAELAETNAAASEAVTVLSAAAAAASETAAGVSETNAAASETAAGLSAAAASGSETAAGLSAAAASASEGAAAASETAAAASETAAGVSETNAAASETAAGLSAAAASGSETAAGLSAAAASASEGAAATSELNAALSETAAGLSAAAASGSETAAAASETAAGLSETNAAASETAAGLSAAAASGSEGAAATSETNAAASETAAGVSETNAAASETAAGVSEIAAQNAQSYAEEWANKAEDSLVSAAAGGDLTDDYSALHWANKAAASAADAAVFDPSSYVPKTGGTFTGAVDFTSPLTCAGLTSNGAVTAPSATFNSNTDPQLTIQDGTSTGTNPTISLKRGNGTESGVLEAIGGSLFLSATETGSDLIFRTNGTTTALTIDGNQNFDFSGNVRIGVAKDFTIKTADDGYNIFMAANFGANMGTIGVTDSVSNAKYGASMIEFNNFGQSLDFTTGRVTNGTQGLALTLDQSQNATFSGNVTVEGAFTSLGIDDNATGERVQIFDTGMSLGTGSDNFAIGTTGGGLFLYGSSTFSDSPNLYMGSTNLDIRHGPDLWTRFNESDGSILFNTGVGTKTTAITIDSNQDATFSGSITASSAVFDSGSLPQLVVKDGNGSDAYIFFRDSSDGLEAAIGTTSNVLYLDSRDTGGGIQLRTNGVTTALTLDSNQDATFTGDVTCQKLTTKDATEGVKLVGSSTDLSFYNTDGSTLLYHMTPSAGNFFISADPNNSVASTNLILRTDGTNALTIDENQDATFEGEVAINQALVVQGKTNLSRVNRTTNIAERQTWSTDREIYNQISGTASPNAALAIQSWSTNSGAYYAPLLVFAKSNGTLGTNGIVSNSTSLGAISFNGNDGTRYQLGARIEAEVDATPGAGSMPTRLIFETTKDGQAYTTEAMRLTSDQDAYFASNVNIRGTIGQTGGNLYLRQSVDTSAGGFRMSRSNAAASWTQWVNSSSAWNLGYANPSTANPGIPAITIDNTNDVEFTGQVLIGKGTDDGQSAELHVDGSANFFRAGNTSQYLRIADLGSTGNAIQAICTESNKKPLYLDSLHDDAGSPNGGTGVVFRLGSLASTFEAMRISQAGQLLIGTPTAKTNMAESSVLIQNGSPINSTVSATADELVLETNESSGMTILSGDTSTGNIFFGDSASSTAGRLVYDHNVNSMHLYTTGSTRMSINWDGVVTVRHGLVVGYSGKGDSTIYFHDDNSNTNRSLFWDDSENEFRVEDNSGTMQTLAHSGNLGDLGGGGVWELIETWTATAVTSKTFTLDETQYRQIRFVFDKVSGTGDGGNIRMRLGYNNGATMFTGGNDYEYSVLWQGDIAFRAANITYVPLTGITNGGGTVNERGVGTAAGEAWNGWVDIGGIGTTAGYVPFTINGGWGDLSGNAYTSHVFGSLADVAGDTNAIDSVQFYWSGGAFDTTAKIHVYGMKL
jgi:hypothetical protein